MGGSWPLIGREAEYARVLDLAHDADAPGVVLAGPAGVGKTRLGDECAAAIGAVCLTARATRAAAAIPFGAFAGYLPPEGLPPAPDCSNLRRAADALLENFKGAERGVLYVDDAHALDHASAALVMHLARANVVFLLVTLRIGEDVPDVLRELWKELLPRIDLAPLDRGAVAALLPSILGGDLDDRTEHALHAAARGNVLYLRELVFALVDAGTLEHDRGQWRLRGELTAPPRLEELVAERLHGLSGREQFVLQAIALTEPLGIKVTEELGWRKEWTSLKQRGLIVLDRSERRRNLSLAHPLYGEIARAAMPSRRKQAILRGVAEAFPPLGLKRRDDARRMAVWQMEAGDPADPDVLLRAARDARLAADHKGSARFARAALDAGAGPAAAHLLGTSLDAIGENSRAEAVLAQVDTARTGDTDRTLVAIARSDNLFRGLARARDADKVLDVALALVRDPMHREELVAQRAMFALFEGRVADTLVLTEPLLARPDDAAYCRGALPAAMVRILAGAIDDAVRIATRAFEMRVALGDAVHLPNPGLYLVALALAQEGRGELAQAEATAGAAYEQAAALNAHNGLAWLATALGRVHLSSGRVRTAMRFAREAAVIFGELNHPGTRWGYGLLALAAAQAGEAGVAEEAIADLDAEPKTPMRMMDTDLERARAWSYAVRGDLPRARAVLLEAARYAHRGGLFMLEAAALHDATRLGGAAETAQRLQRIAWRVDGLSMAARVSYARALAAGDGPALEGSAETFESFGGMLDAAEAWNEAAIAYRRASEPHAAAAAAQRAKAAAEHCEQARTPSLAQGTDAAVLTRREREIATLASHGLANKEIAEALVVSARTVENHLQRAYEKLGVSSRSGLSEALTRAGY